MNYTFNLEKLQERIGKLCPCLIANRENSTQENMCVCQEFLNSGHCRCGLFVNEKEKNV